jgi:hypothetical protein
MGKQHRAGEMFPQYIENALTLIGKLDAVKAREVLTEDTEP